MKVRAMGTLPMREEIPTGTLVHPKKLEAGIRQYYIVAEWPTGNKFLVNLNHGTTQQVSDIDLHYQFRRATTILEVSN